MSNESLSAASVLELVNRLKDVLVARATGGSFEGGDAAYESLRRELRQYQDVYSRLPEFVRKCTNLDEYWNFIRRHHSTYRERREFIWESFAPVIQYLELIESRMGVISIDHVLADFDFAAVHAVWNKALQRRFEDPEGAITAARSFIEAVCKHILEEAKVNYPQNIELPKLWHLTAKHLNLAPSQQQEPIFRRILGNCEAIVSSLGAIRNSVGDAHGHGRSSVKPSVRHAELAVNLAGTMAAFLLATWQDQREADAHSAMADRHEKD